MINKDKYSVVLPDRDDQSEDCQLLWKEKNNVFQEIIIILYIILENY